MGYSEAFKLKVVAEYESGKISLKALQNKYNIGGNATIHNWVRSYGKLGLDSNHVPIDTSVRVSEKLENITLKNELEQARIKIAALEALIEISSKQTGVDFKKKFGGKP
jgi:transposase-like protein